MSRLSACRQCNKRRWPRNKYLVYVLYNYDKISTFLLMCSFLIVILSSELEAFALGISDFVFFFSVVPDVLYGV